MYENRIKHLEEAHRMLDKKINGLERSGVFDDFEIEELKKKRLQLKDEIVLLQAKQSGLEE